MNVALAGGQLLGPTTPRKRAAWPAQRSGNDLVSFDLLVVDGPNAVPEPGSLPLAASALGGLARLRRRRAQS